MKCRSIVHKIKYMKGTVYGLTDRKSSRNRIKHV